MRFSVRECVFIKAGIYDCRSPSKGFLFSARTINIKRALVTCFSICIKCINNVRILNMYSHVMQCMNMVYDIIHNNVYLSMSVNCLHIFEFIFWWCIGHDKNDRIEKYKSTMTVDGIFYLTSNWGTGRPYRQYSFLFSSERFVISIKWCTREFIRIIHFKFKRKKI